MHSQIFATHDLGNGRAISVYGVESNANSKRSYWPYDINIVEHPKELSDNGMLSFKSKDVHLLERETVNSISTGPKSRYQKTIDEMTARIDNPSDEQLEAWKQTKNNRLLKTFGNDLMKGNKAGVDRGLKSGININGLGVKSNHRDFHATPLHVATYGWGGESIVKHLISRGAEVNAKDANGNTPLHYASEEGRGANIIEHLISCGADVNAMNDVGKTPLHGACAYRHEKNIVSLLRNGAKNSQNNSPLLMHDDGFGLFCAIKAERSDIVKDLIKGGVDVNKGPYDGLVTVRPLEQAIKTGNQEVMKLLLSAPDIEPLNDEAHKRLEGFLGSRTFVDSFFERQALNQALPAVQSPQQAQTIAQSRSRGGRL